VDCSDKLYLSVSPANNNSTDWNLEIYKATVHELFSFLKKHRRYEFACTDRTPDSNF
jgi:hypothetical protein